MTETERLVTRLVGDHGHLLRQASATIEKHISARDFAFLKGQSVRAVESAIEHYHKWARSSGAEAQHR